MSFRRHSRTFLKNRVFLLIVIFTILSVVLMYHALSSHGTKQTYENDVFSVGQKHRLRPKHKKSPTNAYKSGSDSENSVKSLATVLYENLIPQELDMLKNRDLLNTNTKEALTNLLLSLYPSNFANIPDPDEMALEVKHTLADYGFESGMGCRDIDDLAVSGALFASRSKIIERGAFARDKYNNYGFNSYRNDERNDDKSSFAIRSVLGDLVTNAACLKQINDAELCSTMGVYRLLREVLLLSTLHHPSIVRLSGLCLRGSRMSNKIQEKGVIIVTEVGVPLSQEAVFSSTWAQRVKYALQVAHLLNFMDRSLYGSLAFSKVDLKDFVLVGGKTLKLADLDDIEVGEKTCHTNSECILPGLSIGVECKSGTCEGLNSMSNLHLVTKKVLLTLLYSPSGEAAAQLVSDLSSFNMTIASVVAALTDIFNSLPNDQSVVKVKDKMSLNDQIHGNQLSGKEVSQNLEEVLALFDREERKNFPGIYDYYCPESRVKWGCVINVKSLLEAAILCLSDTKCQAFVTFSTHPETEKIMTIVFKNQTDSNPYHSSGNTLFIRKSLVKVKVKSDKEEEIVPVHEHLMASSDIRTCMDSVRQNQEPARTSRENRLMTHLGLKGIREQEWRKAALGHELDTPSRIARLEGSGGGRFQANLLYGEETKKPAEKVTFIAVDGPGAYHKAFAIVYHLDRLLGLYHTPPLVGKTLSANVVTEFRSNIAWGNIFRNLISSDGSMKGVMVVPTPKVMKINKVSLQPMLELVSEIVPFTHPEKLQLEYVMLWWLGRMNLSNHEHLGYKGHLIHFSADKAFGDASLEHLDYFNHCQFSNVVLKNLGCFRCKSEKNAKKVVSRICGLGEEVLKLSHSMLEDDEEIILHGLYEQDIIQAIDSAASDMLIIVDKCIRTHGRTSVLY